MLVTAVIQLTNCGGSSGPFDVYYNSITPANLLATNISCAQLEAGYTITNLPDTATNVVLSGIGLCTDTITIPIVQPTPTPTKTPGQDCNFIFTVTAA